MTRAWDENQKRLSKVAARLGPLKDEVVSRKDYYKLEAELRRLGFSQAHTEDQPICRWEVDRIMVDVMPIDPTILGFSNPWYPLAWETSVMQTLADGTVIRIVTPAAFLATKLTAFFDRGEEDYLSSPDLEDVLFVIDGRPGVIEEIEAEQDDLRSFLADSFSALLADGRLTEALPGYLPPDGASQARLPMLARKLERIAMINRR